MVRPYRVFRLYNKTTGIVPECCHGGPQKHNEEYFSQYRKRHVFDSPDPPDVKQTVRPKVPRLDLAGYDAPLAAYGVVAPGEQGCAFFSTGSASDAVTQLPSDVPGKASTSRFSHFFRARCY